MVKKKNDDYIDFANTTDKIVAINITNSIKSYKLIDKDFINYYANKAWKAGENMRKATVVLAYRTIPSGIKGVPSKRLVMAVFGMDSNEGYIELIESESKNKIKRKILMLKPADETTEKKFVSRFLPPLKPGDRNPVRYFGNWPWLAEDGITKIK